MAFQRDVIMDHVYMALWRKDYARFAEACHKFREGPLQRITVHNDTVLHIAAQSKQADLVLELLEKLKAADNQHQRLSHIRNNAGDTILHDVATCDSMKDAAEKLLETDPSLLTQTNKLGEKPIFSAARCAQRKMFDFLAEKMELRRLSSDESLSHLQRKDGTTVFHVCIINRRFGLASSILQQHPYLVNKKDGSSRTALQYIASNPSAFRRWINKKQIKRGVIEKFENPDDQGFTERSTAENMEEGLRDLFWDFCKYCSSRSRYVCSKLLPRCFSIDERTPLSDGEYDDGLDTKSFSKQFDVKLLRWFDTREVLKRLVEKDTSLMNTKINLEDSYRPSEVEEEDDEDDSIMSPVEEKQGDYLESLPSKEYMKSNGSPLFIATKYNNKFIIKAILMFRPQAIEETNEEGMNVLHVAILYRHVDIFNMVIEHEVLAVRRLLTAVDNKGNSVLHMVSQKRKGQGNERMQSPALQLRDELRLFEKVKSACKNLTITPLNNDNKTAEELFDAANEPLHRDAQEWLMRTTENCTILSVFIATVAFAAIFTVPGGPNQDTGIPILRSQLFFMVFILSDVISISLALTSVGIFLSILTSSFPLEDFRTYLFEKLIQGIVCLVLSVSMMTIAFGATIVLMMMSHNRNNTAVWSVVAFLPVPIFFLSYSPLRSSAMGAFRPYLVYLSLPVLCMVIGFPVILYSVLYLTLQKAGNFVAPLVNWIHRKFQPTTCTQSAPQPITTPPQTQV